MLPTSVIVFSDAFLNSFVGLSRTLPTTAYAKMIDIWMIFCMFNPFMEVLLHALSQMLVRELEDVLEEERRFSDQTLEKFEAWLLLVWKLFGCLALIFIVSYWTIALLHKSSVFEVTSAANADCLKAD